MGRIDEIKVIIENNSRTIKKLTLKIQELKEEIEKIDSRIKWIPASELDEEGEKIVNRRLTYYPNPRTMPGETPYSYVKEFAKEEQILKLKKKKEKLSKELDSYIVEYDRLKKENINLRLELEKIKKN